MQDNSKTTRSGMAAGALPDVQQRRRLRRWRGFKDHAARYSIGAFGYSVIAALALIFIYLASEVLPMLLPADVTEQASYAAPGGTESRTYYTTVGRHLQVGVRYTDDQVVFFDPDDGSAISAIDLPVPADARITSFALAEPRSRKVAYGFSNGQVLVAEHDYNERYQDGGRAFDPAIEFPLQAEESPLLQADNDGRAVTALGFQSSEDGSMVAAALDDGSLRIVRVERKTSFMTGEVTLRRSVHNLPSLPGGASANRILLDTAMDTMLVGDDRGQLHYFDVSNPSAVELVDSLQVIEAEGGAEVSALQYLLGTVSVIVGGSEGSVRQYMLVRDEANVRRLQRVRDFQSHDAAVTQIAPEYIRKGFATTSAAGDFKIHYATSSQTLLSHSIAEVPLPVAGFSARANALMAVDANEQFHYFQVDNPHPEVSLKALWGEVWYEGRSEPDYVWQSSSATDEFEPKFSLTPLTLGTLKAAFYAMVFAMPLAILGAVYSAYFMSPRLRGMVKPTIEIMEALPTVILGFLAGLWLAPFFENHLPAIFSILLLMPFMVVGAAALWMRVLSGRVTAGWEAALLIPVVLLTGWACISVSPFLEALFFDGNMRQWLTDMGITYDQRNAMVVGVAMGFAVIPTIYSIAEDAVFNVPKHLTQGSLALGATPWQTVTRVVLLTASPGIFSAVMIGFGRAVGETMIVLMATGNSPIMNFNIFEGMRTLSANIAVEMPEAAVGSTHYRILFLAGLVLFILTFALNTVAEVVRDRLRKRYSSL